MPLTDTPEYRLTDFHPSAHSVLHDLRAAYPDTSFLALGQTIWWDEPMKAVLRKMLTEMSLGGRMVLGVHDTDYFAKAQLRQSADSRFEMMAHNDGSTKDLWSAAGEISRLFGSETFPTRGDFSRYRVPFNKVARTLGRERLEFLNEVTEAWGWRGLVYTGSRDLIVHCLPLADVRASLEALLSWGFDGTADSVVDNCCREEARALAGRMLEWVREYENRPDAGAYLTSLYQALFPLLFEALLGRQPEQTEVVCSAHLLRLAPETAGLPRFEFVDLFLNEKTRALAAEAYDQAIAGTEIYTLERFGLGALPFDVILPKQGRGTLRVTLRAIHIETREPIRIPLQRPVTSVQELAEVLTRELGDHVTLVGKAVALISMLAREFIFVFNEEGSAYVTRTRKMNDALRAAGIPLHQHPILRMKYHTWDSLAVADSSLALPEHLTSAFGQGQIPARDFAGQWREVVEEQGRLLEEIRSLTRPRDLLAFLGARAGGQWPERLADYNRAKAELVELRREAAAIQQQVDGLYQTLAQLRRDIEATEQAKGDHFRAVSEIPDGWTGVENETRAAFDRAISDLLARRRALLAQVKERKAARLELERGPSAAPLRERLEAIEGEAEYARLQLVRNAILTRSGLVHTDHRPTAWWLPMVDPSGKWFQRIAETTEVYVQPLLS